MPARCSRMTSDWSLCITEVDIDMATQQLRARHSPCSVYFFYTLCFACYVNNRTGYNNPYRTRLSS